MAHPLSICGHQNNKRCFLWWLFELSWLALTEFSATKTTKEASFGGFSGFHGTPSQHFRPPSRGNKLHLVASCPILSRSTTKFTTHISATSYMSYFPPYFSRIYDTRESYTPHVVFPGNLSPHLRHIKKQHLICRVPQESFSAFTTYKKVTSHMSCSPEIPLRTYDTRESYAVHVVFPRNPSPHLRHKRKLHPTCRVPGQKNKTGGSPPVSCSIFRSDYSSVFSSAGASTSTAFAARNSAAFCRRISFLMFSAPASPR